MTDPFSGDIEKLTLKNNYYRKVIHTTNQQQLVLMSIDPGGYIHQEVHPKTTQFIRIEEGNGVASIDGKRKLLKPNTAIVIPPGSIHKILNTSMKEPMKLYTIYSPPEHEPNTIQKKMSQSD